DDALLAHAARQQDLAEHVVHLVGAGVVEILALEVNPRAAEVLGRALGEIQRARPPDIMFEIRVHLRPEGGVRPGLPVCLLQLEDERHQRLGDEAAAEHPEMAALVGTGAERVRLRLVHAAPPASAPMCAGASRTARTKARIMSGSLRPGARSTPEDTSTP